MANPQKGEVEFQVAYKTYKFILSINAMCELEDALGDGVMNVLQQLQDPTKVRFKLVRAVFWAGLHDCHPDINVEDAGKLISELGINPSMEIVAKAVALAFPEVVASPLAQGQPAHQNGTGKASSPPG